MAEWVAEVGWECLSGGGRGVFLGYILGEESELRLRVVNTVLKHYVDWLSLPKLSVLDHPR